MKILNAKIFVMKKINSFICGSVKRLIQKGLVIKSDKGFELDDPFFGEWIVMRRSGDWLLQG